jgi:hypothetical protein
LLCHVAQSTTGETAFALTSFSGTLFRVLEYYILGTCCCRDDFPCLGMKQRNRQILSAVRFLTKICPGSRRSRHVALWPGSMRASTGRVVVYGCLRRRLPARRPCPRSHLPRPPWPPRWRPPELRRRRCRRPTVCVWWRRCNRFLTLVGPGPSSRSAIGA